MSKKVAVVTGAAGGIGRAISLQLANDGFEVALCDLSRQQEGLDKVAQEISQAHQGLRISKVFADVSVESDVQALIETVVKEHGGLDVFVANAGILLTGSIVETSVETWEKLFAVNARGVFLCYKYAGVQMIKQGKGGRLIGASSIAGKQGSHIASAYSATKFAVRGLTQAAAQEFGRHGITVNAYAPGIINTTMLDGTIPNMSLQDVLEQEKKTNATGTSGEPDDIALLVSYLASPGSKYMTGQTVSVNGGRYFD